MPTNPIVIAVYGLFLLVILAINLLYFFQIFRYRLPGDASVFIVIGHLSVMLFILFAGSIFISY